MKPIVYLFLALSLPHFARGQEDIPLLLPEEKRAVKAQEDQFNEAISPALGDASKSTVRVWAGSKRLAYGTVVGDGTKVLSKWSEISRATGVLRIGTANGAYHPITVAGVYEEDDLVLLNVEGGALVPIKWSLESPKLGTFIAAPQPDGRLASFGVVSVLERNLRDTDMAYLGVIAEPKYTGDGVQIAEVPEGSGAYDSGLKTGDIILKVGDRPVSGLLELKSSLNGIEPGTTIKLTMRIKGKTKVVDVLLGNRPEMPKFGGERLRVMERMGGPISKVGDSFTHAIQTDMKPKPNQIGGPVVDLHGHALGITIARTDRTRSFVMPAAAVIELLKTTPQDPEEIKARQQQLVPRVVTRRGSPGGGSGGPPGGGRMQPGSEDRLRRHLSDMERLMDHMRKEMEMLENP